LTNFLILYVLMRRETRSLASRDLLAALGKIGLATAALAAVCWAAQIWLFPNWTHSSLWLRTALLVGTITVAAAVFFGAALLFGFEELNDVASVLRQKFQRLMRK
jgi:peptidoglycan biosynthesis protein MviN/MurJ (putative lipid II flippase)